ncbi:MAG: membrane protein [Chitinophagales bacterium]|nr:MAG: membrane protein [Chitinophagales bacterium]
MADLLIYGANGYTGQLIVQRALFRGLKPIIAGRNEAEIKKLAQQYQLEYRIFGLSESEAICRGLQGVKVVIHAAGPFMYTAQPMLEACLKTKTHYLDITGEIEVFERCAGYDAPAKEAGIMVMPGTGFDVVPSDCLAAHLKRRLPDAHLLQLAFASLGGGFSRGTAKTMVENLGRGGAIRKDGKIIPVPNAFKTMTIDYGDFKMQSVCIPWGDVSTAWRSTGIANIEVYMGANTRMIRAMKAANWLGWLLKTRMVKNFLKNRIDAGPPGPSEAKRKKAQSHLWGRVTNLAGQSCTSLLITPEGYTLTALTSVHIAEKTLSGNFKTGYQTPSLAYGPDLILETEGCIRKDL